MESIVQYTLDRGGYGVPLDMKQAIEGIQDTLGGKAKKVIRDAKFKAYDDHYDKLGTKDGKKDVYKLAKLRERKTRDFNHIKCINNEDSRVLV